MKKTIHSAFIFSLLSIPVMQTAYAVESCKGLPEADCISNSCSWVDAYQRKDGINVKGHCRVARKSLKQSNEEISARAN